MMALLPLVGLFVGTFGQTKEASKYPDFLDIIKTRATAGAPYYMAAYAEVLRRGEYGVSIDKDAALKWARKSAATGHALGKYNVWAIKKDDALIPQFLDGLKQLATDGSSRAQSCLGVMHHFGNGVSKDDKAAVKWYGKAADQGYAFRTTILASCTTSVMTFQRMPRRLSTIIERLRIRAFRLPSSISA